MIPRDQLDNHFYDELDKFRKHFPHDTHAIVHKTFEGIYRLTQTDTVDAAYSNADYMNTHEMNNGRKAYLSVIDIADIPDRLAPEV